MGIAPVQYLEWPPCHKESSIKPRNSHTLILNCVETCQIWCLTHFDTNILSWSSSFVWYLSCLPEPVYGECRGASAFADAWHASIPEGGRALSQGWQRANSELAAGDKEAACTWASRRQTQPQQNQWHSSVQICGSPWAGLMAPQ